MATKDYFNTCNVSSRVYHLAQVFYKEFELMHDVYGNGSYNRILPLVVKFLEEFDRLVGEKQKLDFNFNLMISEKSDLLVQLNREKQLYSESKKRINSLEDELSTLKKLMDEKLEELQLNVNQYKLLTKVANEQVFRLEERSSQMKMELSAQNERYAELLRMHMDYVSCHPNPDSKYSGESKLNVDSFVAVSHLPTLTSVNHSPKSDQSESYTGLDQLEVMNASSNLNRLKSTNHGSFIDLYDEALDYEYALQVNNSVTPAVEEDADDTAAVNEPIEANENSFGVAKEIEKMIRENLELCETKNALNILKDDLLRKVDEITGEKIILSQELDSLRLSRDENRSEVIRQSRQLHECQSRIASLEFRLKDYENVDRNEMSQDDSGIGTKLTDNSLWTLSERTAQCMASARSLLNLNATTSRELDTLRGDRQSLVASDWDDEEQLAKTLEKPRVGDVCFTKREMAKILAERNMFKERFLEMQDAVRLSQKTPSMPSCHDHDHAESADSSSSLLAVAFNSLATDLSTGFNFLVSAINDDQFASRMLPNEAQCITEITDTNVGMTTDDSRKSSFASFGKMFNRLFGYGFDLTYNSEATGVEGELRTSGDQSNDATLLTNP